MVAVRDNEFSPDWQARVEGSEAKYMELYGESLDTTLGVGASPPREMHSYSADCARGNARGIVRLARLGGMIS